MKKSAIALAIGLWITGAIAYAEVIHNPPAVEHTKQAITHGEAGHAPLLAEHASTALTHAKASQQAEPSPHTEEAINHLNAAIESGKNNNAAEGTVHAKKALEHLEKAAAPATAPANLSHVDQAPCSCRLEPRTISRGPGRQAVGVSPANSCSNEVAASRPSSSAA